MKLNIWTGSAISCLILISVLCRDPVQAANSDPTRVTSKFAFDPNFGVHIRPTFRPTLSKQVRSLLHCTIACQMSTTCLAIAYCSEDKVCELYAQSVGYSVEAILDPTSHYLEKINSYGGTAMLPENGSTRSHVTASTPSEVPISGPTGQTTKESVLITSPDQYLSQEPYSVSIYESLKIDHYCYHKCYV